MKNTIELRRTSLKRAGFTLVELIVTLAVLSVISLAITSIFQFSTRSFRQTTLRADQQAETRLALNYVKKEISFAKSVIVSDVIPSTLPTGIGHGYCYFDQTTRKLIVRSMDGKVTEYFQALPDDLSINIHFEPISAVVNTPYDSIQFIWQVGSYDLGTIAYIQNMKHWLGSSVSATYTTGPGKFIQFSN